MNDDKEALPKGIDIQHYAGDIKGDVLHALTVNGETVAMSCCRHHIRRLAQALDHTRSLPSREAMHHLISVLGFCELTAEWLFTHLHGGMSPTGSRH